MKMKKEMVGRNRCNVERLIEVIMKKNNKAKK